MVTVRVIHGECMCLVMIIRIICSEQGYFYHCCFINDAFGLLKDTSMKSSTCLASFHEVLYLRSIVCT